MSSGSHRGRREPWRSNERHYCAACNTWMGSDRASILIHEQGKKHKENVAKALDQKRDDRAKKDQAAKNIQKALAQINQVAVSSHLQDVGTYGVSALHGVAAEAAIATETGTQQNKQPQGFASQTPSAIGKIAKGEEITNDRAAWESRKKKREDEKRKDKDDDDSEESDMKKARRHLDPEEGNYTLGDETYLEGVTFVDVLEDEMPVQVWTGSNEASLAEKRLPEKQHLWRTGLIIKVRRSSQEKETGKVVDVAYLKDPADEDETVEQSVPPNRIRIILGGDPSIPDTLEEARIAATGGQVTETNIHVLEVDENTGLSAWGTIEIRKTTERQELKEERELARKKRREESERRQTELKRAEELRMEEARVENAEDSALGAYDVWNSGKAGYKGIDVNTNQKMTAADVVGFSLSGGKKVAFKKNSFQKGKKTQNRRITSSDDL